MGGRTEQFVIAEDGQWVHIGGYYNILFLYKFEILVISSLKK